MLGVTGRDEISALLTALASADAEQVLSCSKELSVRGVDFSAVLADLLRAFHDIAVAQILPNPNSEEGSEADKERATDLIADSLGVRFANSFAPDVVQLFYQIVLRSHHDLAMSPDPQIGFEMALMRMLAFAPDDVKQSVPPLASPSSVANGVADGSAGNSEGHDEGAPSASGASGAQSRSELQSEPAVAAPPQRVNALVASKQKEADKIPLPRAPDAFWYDLQEKVAAQGVVSMIMRNCILQRREALASNSDAERWYLQLDPAHDGMLSDRHPAQIASLVSAAVKGSVDINLEVTAPVWETPGMQLTRERKERQTAAVSLMRESAMTKSLSEIFGAQLDEESVRPITDRQLHEQPGEQS